jgi:hypothetical protein
MGKKKGNQPAPHPDAELFALVEQYIVAEQKYCDLNAEVDDMEGMMHNAGRDRENNPLPGYKAAVRKKDKADTAYIRIEKRIANLRAKTIEGLYAKVRCALAYAKAAEIDEIEGGSCADNMARSIFTDLQELSKAGPA